MHVRVDNRLFIVAFDDDGNPLSIKERKTSTVFGVEKMFDVSYWHTWRGGNNPGTLVARILAAAKEKQQ